MNISWSVFPGHGELKKQRHSCWIFFLFFFLLKSKKDLNT